MDLPPYIQWLISSCDPAGARPAEAPFARRHPHHTALLRRCQVHFSEKGKIFFKNDQKRGV
jgi:hypothetical protein